jgi:hypothetical protein
LREIYQQTNPRFLANSPLTRHFVEGVMQCNIIQCNAVRFNEIQYDTIQYNAIQHPPKEG